MIYMSRPQPYIRIVKTSYWCIQNFRNKNHLTPGNFSCIVVLKLLLRLVLGFWRAERARFSHFTGTNPDDSAEFSKMTSPIPSAVQPCRWRHPTVRQKRCDWAEAQCWGRGKRWLWLWTWSLCDISGNVILCHPMSSYSLRQEVHHRASPNQIPCQHQSSNE